MNCVLFLAGFAAITADPSLTAQWPSFRGDGRSVVEKGSLPTAWTPTSGIAWRVTLPGYGQSSPVIWGDSVYVLSIEGEQKETLHITSLDRSTGSRRWIKSFPASVKGKNNPMMSRAAGTPVVDAAGIVAMFESGDVIALKSDGSTRWTRSLSQDYGEFKNNHGTGSSLVQTDDAVYALVDHQGPSYLIALAKVDGATRWKTDRAPRSSWTSPVIQTIDAIPFVMASSAGSVTAYRAKDGSVAFERDGFVGNTIPSPTPFGSQLIIGATENRMKPDKKATADSNCCLTLTATSNDVKWRSKGVAGHHASPLVHAGHVYFVDKTGIVSCLDVMTGQERYSERLDNPQWATPIGCGSHVYFFGKDGVTTVLKAGPDFEKVMSNRLWSDREFKVKKEAAQSELKNVPSGPPGGRTGGGSAGMSPDELAATRSSAVGHVVYGVAAVPGHIVIRTGTELFCIRSTTSNTEKP